jgi:dipeptide/tripeptide permease
MERLAYYSLATDLVTRLDMLGASSASAASTTMTWQGACYLVSIFGAWTADARLGRYWTIVLFSSVYLVGLAGVVVSTGVAALSSRAWLMGALYIVALGTGGIKV